MLNDLFDTEQKKAEAITAFEGLLEHPGWKFFVAILDANIEVLRMQLEEGGIENETKADVDRMRDKLKLMREMRNTPEDQIRKLQTEEQEVPNPDPFPEQASDGKEEETE